MSTDDAVAQMDPVRLAFVNFLRERRGLPLIGVRAAQRYPLTAAMHKERDREAAQLERIRVKREVQHQEYLAARDAEISERYFQNLIQELT